MRISSFGIEVEPALAALVLRPAVPGDRQRLQAAIGKLDQVLLQRIEAEGVLDLERGELAVGAVGLDEELAVLAEEARAHAVIVEARVVEIAEHRFLGRVVHRVLVLRGAPQLRLRPVAAGAGLAADECGGCWFATAERLARPSARLFESQPDGHNQRCHSRNSNEDRPSGQSREAGIASIGARSSAIRRRGGRTLRCVSFPRSCAWIPRLPSPLAHAHDPRGPHACAYLSPPWKIQASCSAPLPPHLRLERPGRAAMMASLCAHSPALPDHGSQLELAIHCCKDQCADAIDHRGVSIDRSAFIDSWLGIEREMQIIAS